MYVHWLFHSKNQFSFLALSLFLPNLLQGHSGVLLLPCAQPSLRDIPSPARGVLREHLEQTRETQSSSRGTDSTAPCCLLRAHRSTYIGSIYTLLL